MGAPYRDDDDALRARLRALTDQLEVGQARAKELRDLEQSEGDLSKEIEGIRRELDRRAARRREAEEGRPPGRMGRRVMLGAVGSGLVAAGAWALRPPMPMPSPDSSRPVKGPEPVPVDKVLVDRLATGAVYHDTYARRVLYTWTNADQVEELRKTRVLLTRTRSATKGQSFFDKRRELNLSTIGMMFGEPALVRRRFAWTSPWATVRGIGASETYGDRLVRIVLKPDAILAYFGGTDAPWWSFTDLQKQAVDLDEMVAHPARIAGVFHAFDGEGEAGPYREFVLCNESAIEEWSVDTPEIEAEVAASIDTLRRLRAAIERDPPDLAAMEAGAASVPRRVWANPVKAPSIAALYEANLAFPGPRYRLDAATIGAMIETLSSLPSGEPLVHRPDIRFPGFREGAVARGPGRVYGAANSLPSVRPEGWSHAVKCLPRGTFGCTPLGEP